MKPTRTKHRTFFTHFRSRWCPVMPNPEHIPERVEGVNWNDSQVEVNWNDSQVGVNWNTFQVGVNCRDIQYWYEEYIDDQVSQCPINLFDCERGRIIGHGELKKDINISLAQWVSLPLTCNEVMDTISSVVAPKYGDAAAWLKGEVEDIAIYVSSAMAKHPPFSGLPGFLRELDLELKCYNSMLRQKEDPHPPLPIKEIIQSVDELAEQMRFFPSLPLPHHILEQINFSSQYAIMSHRWEQDDQELTFHEAVTFPCHDPSVRQKKGFKKLEEFLHVVRSLYGCRYLWMDSICIGDADRATSIPRMFNWYRRAHVCVVYLSTGLGMWADPWSKRGWTLQEYLAARRIKTVQEGEMQFELTTKIDAARNAQEKLNLQRSRERPQGRWYTYTPNVEEAVWLFRQMIGRTTTESEDKAYCLFSALRVDIPIKYGEGFDNAFYRLQIACLSKAQTFDLLLWSGHVSSPRNSLLARDFPSFTFIRRYEAYQSTNRFRLDGEGIISIFVTLIPWDTSRERPLRERWLAILGDCFSHTRFVGVLLERLYGPRQIYRRVRLEEYKPPEGFVLPARKWVKIM